MPQIDQVLLEIERLHAFGQIRRATVVCDDYLDGAVQPADRILALTAKGTLAFDSGRVTCSIDALRLAVGLTDREGLDDLAFPTSLSLFSRESQFQSPEEALSLLAKVRQLASRAGNASALGSLHLVVARLEGFRGLCVSARRHVELCRTLLRDGPPSIHGAIHLVDASLEISAGNLDRARKAAVAGLEIARRASRNITLAGCLTNMGSVALLLGKHQQSQELLNQAIGLSGEFLLVKFSAVDALAQVSLATGATEECESHLVQCRQLTEIHRVPARSWYDLAHQVTRCAYHERVKQWTEIVSIAEATDPELARRQYKAVRTALLCAKARALARLGEHEHADSVLSLAVRTLPRSAVDPLIVLEASRATCAALRGETAVANSHFDRALAGCRTIGHRYHERWISATRDELSRRSTCAAPGPHTLDPAAVGLVLADVATILGGGHSIDLMAHRTASLLQGTALGPRVEVEREGGCDHQPDPSASWETQPDGTFAIHLRGSDRRISIRVRRVDTIDEIALLKGVADLVQVAVNRTADPEQEDDDQNLWPKAVIASDEDAIFRSPHMVELLKIATRLAATDLPVLITGETGTGKEIFARLIHDHSKHRRGPFVPFNCSAVPRDLVESQLFGHRRGAFTGAHDSPTGVVRSAERGTLFLDEVGDLDLGVQPKLLRFLEHGEIHAVGEPRPQEVKVRLVAATNADIEGSIQRGSFRRDLFYRLGVAKLTLPPLRERKDEIPALASLFLSRSARECGRTGLKLGDDFVAALLLHDWPGNIRELSNEIRRVVALAGDGDLLGARNLAPAIARHWIARPALAPVPSADGGFFVKLDQTLAEAVNDLEEQFIDRALQTTGGRVAEAAQLLGLSRKGLFLKRRRRGLVASTSVAAQAARQA